MIDLTGQCIGGYQLEGLVGTGGFAAVYLGRHRRLKTQVALKVFHAQRGEEAKELFANEVGAIARLQHPHIVRLLDYGIDKGHIPYLVMEYLPFGTLRQVYGKGTPLPLSIIVRYTHQIAEALQHVHDAQYIHRDVKPENILVESPTYLRLSDFGLAVAAQSPYSTLPLSGQQIAGSLGYIAPEQIEDQPCAASDQYALGVVVYEWLCGHLPFHGTIVEILAKHCFALPPPLHMYAPMIPPDIEQVVLRALAKDWRARFATVRDFALALEQATGGCGRELIVSST